MSMKSVLKVIIFISNLLLVFNVGFLRAAPKTDNGAYAINGKLLDIHEFEKHGIECIEDVTKLLGFKEFVRPILERVKILNADFYIDLIDILRGKVWFFIGTEIDANEAFIKQYSNVDDLRKVAKQMEGMNEIYILKPYFMNLNIDPSEQYKLQGGIILHELVLGVSQWLNKNEKRAQYLNYPIITYEDVVNLNQRLIYVTNMDRDKLFQYLKIFNFQFQNSARYNSSITLKTTRLPLSSYWDVGWDDGSYSVAFSKVVFNEGIIDITLNEPEAISEWNLAELCENYIGKSYYIFDEQHMLYEVKYKRNRKLISVEYDKQKKKKRDDRKVISFKCNIADRMNIYNRY